MKDDTREELERLEKELLDMQQSQDTVVLPLPKESQPEAAFPQEDILEDPLIQDVLAQPAFEDMDQIHEPEDPMIYCNYSNDYGQDLEVPAGEESPQPTQNSNDKLAIGLMIASSALCLGIIGVMIFWLIKYL